MYKEDNIEAIIAKSISGKITQDENAVLRKWIDESQLNQDYYKELVNIWQVSHPAFSPDDIDVAKAERKVLEQIREKKFVNSKLFMVWQRVAAVMIIPISVFFGYMLYQQPFHSTKIAFQEITSPFGMSSKVDLPDGSTVWLNSGSKLKYPVVFTEHERKVYLLGEAFFKVHSDKKHPFIVSTAKLDVKATGTQFNVEAYLSDSVTAVTLIRGKVSVTMSDHRNEQLEPNQRLILNSNLNSYHVIQTDAHWGMWKDGILAFRDESLEDVFKRIGRTYNVDIKVKDPVVARQIYRATFEGESFDEILRLLKISAPIRYKRIERVERKGQSDKEYKKEQVEVYSSN